jgi:muramoyltetrapeptide carboxypeptidase
MPAARAARSPLLRAGDIVDVVAPGSRCADERLAAGVEFLRGLGLRPRVPPTLFGRDLLCANSDRARLELLRRALAARDSRCVWCVRGGYGAIRLVEPLLRLAPPRRKLFVGYSDATTLHYLINHHWNWPSLHGPLLDRLGTPDVPAPEIEELRAVLLGAAPTTTFSGLTALNAAARRGGSVRSRVFGGNLTVLQTVVGTRLQRAPRQILFLEDTGERAYRVDRTLQHLTQAGVIAPLRAIVFGTFTGGDEPDGRNLVEAVLRRFAHEQAIPVLLGMHAGHGPYQRPLFFNAPAELACGRAPWLRVTTPQPLT